MVSDFVLAYTVTAVAVTDGRLWLLDSYLLLHLSPDSSFTAPSPVLRFGNGRFHIRVVLLCLIDSRFVDSEVDIFTVS